MYKDLAIKLRRTAMLHEESGLAKEKTHLGNYQMNMSIQDAAKKVCGDAAWFPVYLLLSETWNDALDWADNPDTYKDISPEEVKPKKI